MCVLGTDECCVCDEPSVMVLHDPTEDYDDLGYCQVHGDLLKKNFPYLVEKVIA